MALTDQELMLLEHMTYLNDDVKTIADVEVTGTTVGEMLECFDEEALKRLEEYTGEPPQYCNGKKISGDDVSAYMTGKEWAAMIRELKANKNISDLKCKGYDSSVYVHCFEDSEGNAYVAFKGTTGGEEWKDNVEGLNESDTEKQKEALDYIESLPYDNITVVGHSKGGNKAQYVTITSDKVTRCVSMDGQGFSQEFIDKYGPEIKEKAGCIKNYSLSTDYVHILLFPMPGAEQIYCQGDEDNAGLRNHSPGAFFQYNDGRIVVDGDGQVYLEYTTENKGMTYLHEFTCFIINVMPDDKKEQVVEYIGIALALAMSSKYPITIDGKTYTQKNITEFLMSDQETAALVIAYVMKYAEVNNLTDEELFELLKAMGFGDWLEKMQEAIRTYCVLNPHAAASLNFGRMSVLNLLRFFYDNLTDGKKDPILMQFFNWLDGWLQEEFGFEIDITDTWENIETEYSEIKVENKKTATKDATISNTRMFDYSNECYNALLDTISTINKSTSLDVSSWNSYKDEMWFTSLGIFLAIKGINGYFNYLHEINVNCKEQIEKVFTEVQSVDQSKANKLKEQRDTIRKGLVQMDEILYCIKVKR